MKISKSTIAVLRNFSEINQGITIKAGSNLRTIDGLKNTFAKAVIPEVFDRNFSIFDIREMLSLISSPENEIIFDDDFLTIVDEKGRKVKYAYSSPSTVFSPSDNDMELDPSNRKFFILLKEDIDALYKKAEILKIYNLYISCDGLRLCMKKNDGNSFEIPLKMECESDKVCLLNLKNLKLLPLDYDVTVYDDVSVHFKSRNEEFMVEYLVTQDYLD